MRFRLPALIFALSLALPLLVRAEEDIWNPNQYVFAAFNPQSVNGRDRNLRLALQYFWTGTASLHEKHMRAPPFSSLFQGTRVAQPAATAQAAAGAFGLPARYHAPFAPIIPSTWAEARTPDRITRGRAVLEALPNVQKQGNQLFRGNAPLTVHILLDYNVFRILQSALSDMRLAHNAAFGASETPFKIPGRSKDRIALLGTIFREYVRVLENQGLTVDVRVVDDEDALQAEIAKGQYDVLMTEVFDAPVNLPELRDLLAEVRLVGSTDPVLAPVDYALRSDVAASRFDRLFLIDRILMHEGYIWPIYSKPRQFDRLSQARQDLDRGALIKAREGFTKVCERRQAGSCIEAGKLYYDPNLPDNNSALRADLFFRFACDLGNREGCRLSQVMAPYVHQAQQSLGQFRSRHFRTVDLRKYAEARHARLKADGKLERLSEDWQFIYKEVSQFEEADKSANARTFLLNARRNSAGNVVGETETWSLTVSCPIVLVSRFPRLMLVMENHTTAREAFLPERVARLDLGSGFVDLIATSEIIDDELQVRLSPQASDVSVTQLVRALQSATRMTLEISGMRLPFSPKGARRAIDNLNGYFGLPVGGTFTCLQ